MFASTSACSSLSPTNVAMNPAVPGTFAVNETEARFTPSSPLAPATPLLKQL